MVCYTGGVLFTFLAIASVFVSILNKLVSRLVGDFNYRFLRLLGFWQSLVFLGFILLSNVNIVFSLTDKNVAKKDSLFKSFSTGALAVILASPCTAPFMGAALGYAIIQSSSNKLCYLWYIRIRFAIPYLVLSFNPS